MIRAHKTPNPNQRLFFDDGEEVGYVHLNFKSPNQSYIRIYGYKDIEINYKLKKRACDYNQQYLARIMRKLFMIEYAHYEAYMKIDMKISDAREEQNMRVMKMTEHLKQYRQDMIVQKQRERIAARNAYMMEQHLTRLEQGHASEFHQEMGF